jgi:hypothetical protein
MAKSITSREYALGLLLESTYQLEALERAERGLRDDEAQALLTLRDTAKVLQNAIHELTEGVNYET